MREIWEPVLAYQARVVLTTLAVCELGGFALLLCGQTSSGLCMIVFGLLILCTGFCLDAALSRRVAEERTARSRRSRCA